MELLQNNIGLIITTITGLLAWLFERTQRKAESKKAEQNIQETETKHQQQVVDLYQEALTDLKKRYDEKFNDLDEEIKQLRKNLELWKTKYKTLKEEFEGYKRNEK